MSNIEGFKSEINYQVNERDWSDRECIEVPDTVTSPVVDAGTQDRVASRSLGAASLTDRETSPQ